MKKIISLILCIGIIISAISVSSFATVINLPDSDIKNVVLTMDSTTSRRLCWRTNEITASDVEVTENGDLIKSNTFYFYGSVSKFKGEYVHKAVITGLKPGKSYSYRVGDIKNNRWSDYGKFVVDDCDSDFKMIAFADVQAFEYEDFFEASKIVAKAIEVCPDAEFIADLGDYVNDCTQEEWDTYFDTFKFANTFCTQVPVAGNHEGNFKHGWFENTFNLNAPDGCNKTTGVYYSFDYGKAHFAVLNTNDMYPMSQQQINWLKNDMNSSNAQWKIVLTHRALYSAGKNIIKPDTVMMRNVLLPIMDELDIDLVLSGHDHMYMRTKQLYDQKNVQNITYIKEMYGQEETTFAVNPDGTTYAIIGTAGTKRYTTREYNFDCLFERDNIDYYFSQNSDIKGGVFTTLDFSDNKLVYKAYSYNPETETLINVDSYAIKKTVENSGNPKAEHLTTNSILLLPQNIFNFFYRFSQMFYQYFTKYLPKLIVYKIQNG